MKKLVLILACVSTLFASDIIIKESKYGVSQTIHNIKTIVKSKGLGVFAVINHKGNAGMVGMEMQESKLIVFGNPKIGTHFMNENILTALDLPVKVLVYRQDDKTVKVAYRNATWLKNTHGLTFTDKYIQKMDNGIENIVNEAIK